MAYTTIDDPSANFQTALYTGTGSTQSITNDGNSNLKPDWVWVKSRSHGSTHNVVFDSSRGVNNRLVTNLTIAEDTGDGYGVVSAFNTDGFTVNPQTNLINVGGDGYTYVAWQWKMNGGTTASNTDGNITSTVQANTTAGQSIVTWTGNEQSTATVGHGLDKAPETIIYKRRNNGTYNWTAHLLQLGTLSNGNTYGGYPNLTNAWEQTTQPAPTATIFKPTNGAPTNSGTMLAYCFHSVQGYSKMGKYVGNGVSDGPFIYTGFKPAFIMIKGNTVNHWITYDHKRPGYNDNSYELYSNLNHAEYTGESYFDCDLMSNGFKMRITDPSINSSGSIYAFMAFAETPFVTSTGVPTTAR
jgi:hypothetical protein